MNYDEKLISAIYKNGGESEIITDLSTIKRSPNLAFTVARIMTEKHCVELHYSDSEAWTEIEQRESEDSWRGNIEEVDWFNLDLTDDEIICKLENEFVDSFGYQYKYLLPRNNLER